MSQQAARIVRDEDVMGGEPVIRGRRITVLRIYALVHERDLPVEEVASMHDLDVADVEAALDYYEENPDVIAEVREWHEEMEDRSKAAGAVTIDEYVGEDEDRQDDETRTDR
ncbi:MAG: hypothetical protein ACI80F_002361 [Natronomonas sp.]|jgi:uncharacterized protein (DUF433 family)|uniref:DUF433 domain-containing protein n=1 Tax=Natronomonas sp. TaxID=2184060 RepID=UPI003988E8EB